MLKFHADELADDNLDSVSRQLGDWFDEATLGKFHTASAPKEFSGALEAENFKGSTLSAYAGPPSLELRETFAVWSLRDDKISEGLRTGADLVQLAEPTGRWHHQVVCNDLPVGFARSVSEDGGGCGVSQLYVSDLAAYIDDAIRWVDEFEKANPLYAASNPLVRLLFIPSYQTHAFWLVKSPPGSSLRALMSQALRGVGINLKPGRPESDVFIIDAPSYLRPLRPQTLLSSRELLDVFRDHEPRGGGLTFAAPPPAPSGS